MRFLADESCDFAVVRALRAAGHEVVAIAEISPRATDEAVVEIAVREERILLTEDKDCGSLEEFSCFASRPEYGRVSRVPWSI